MINFQHFDLRLITEGFMLLWLRTEHLIKISLKA